MPGDGRAGRCGAQSGAQGLDCPHRGQTGERPMGAGRTAIRPKPDSDCDGVVAVADSLPMFGDL